MNTQNACYKNSEAIAFEQVFIGIKDSTNNLGSPTKEEHIQAEIDIIQIMKAYNEILDYRELALSKVA